MSVWCSYTQPCFIPTPGWWFLVGQPYPNDGIKAQLNVYWRTRKDLQQFTSPNSSGHPPLTRNQSHRGANSKYQQHHKY